jgi:hypothetical protein
MARLSFLQLGITAVLAGAPATHALGFVAPQSSLTSTAVSKLLQKGEIVIRPSTIAANPRSFNNRFDAGTSIETDARGGAVRLITGDLSPAPQSIDKLNVSDLVDVATNWIAAHEDLLLVQLEDLTLLDSATLMGPDVQFLRFNVSRDGTQIADATLNFRFKQGKLVQILSRTYGEALDDARTGFVRATDAIESLAAGAGVQEQGQVFRAQPTATGYKLVRVNKSLVSVDGERLAVQTDAATGELFETKNTRHFANGNAHGSVYPRTFFQSQLVDVPMGELDVTAGTATVQTSLNGKFTFTGTTAPSIAGLKGARISITPRTGTAIARTATESSGVWDLNVSATAEKDVAQIHTFHHLNLIIQKAKKYISAPWMEQNLRANVNLGQTCNAYWDGSSVNFYSAGGGCGNTGLISDVMYHEWGHGLDENTGGIDDGAYSEGFGDILSMVMTNDSKLGPGFRSTGGIVRDMEPDKIYPRDKGEVHAEGLIIGGTFWDLLKGLTAKHGQARANDIVSDIAFKTILTANNYTDVYSAALVVNDNDNNTNTRSPDFCEINAAFTLHGLATKAADCN